MDGALVIYHAAMQEEVKRLPMKKPLGKYNVHNRITRLMNPRIGVSGLLTALLLAASTVRRAWTSGAGSFSI